jgi:hypothetical protein
MSMPPPPPPPPGYRSIESHGGAPRPYPRGTLILVLGIASFFFCGIILGLVAFVMGNSALKEIDRDPSAYTNRGIVNAGRICGAIGAAVSVLLLIVVAASA